MENQEKKHLFIKTATFVKSSDKIKTCPPPELPEYAFIGRSNVGKSSLINMLTNHSKLAKTSSEPGKTQLINHFIINDLWYLVDLPGYGFAKAPKELRTKWEAFIDEYLRKRENLMCVFVLIDSRHEAQKIDLDFMEKLTNLDAPFVIVFTKTDKISKGRLAANVEAYKAKMLETWEEMPQYFTSSALERIGRDEIMEFILKLNKVYHKN